jgi:2-polyprenyl-6-methoxyphenol hydroxylase-like FAD-dependent oxidoreductase
MALLEKGQAQGVEVHFGMKLTDLREGDIGVELTFANGQTTEAEFAVDADGVYSKIRPCIMKSELYHSKFTRHHQHEY